MKYFLFKEETFGTYLNLYINCTTEELTRSLQRKIGDKNFKLEDDNMSGRTFVLQKDNNYHRIIWICNFDWSVRSQALLVHELVHFTTQVFEDKGLPISRKEDEVMAYYMEFWVKTIFWKLRKKR